MHPRDRVKQVRLQALELQNNLREKILEKSHAESDLSTPVEQLDEHSIELEKSATQFFKPKAATALDEQQAVTALSQQQEEVAKNDCCSCFAKFFKRKPRDNQDEYQLLSAEDFVHAKRTP